MRLLSGSSSRCATSWDVKNKRAAGGALTGKPGIVGGMGAGLSPSKRRDHERRRFSEGKRHPYSLWHTNGKKKPLKTQYFKGF